MKNIYKLAKLLQKHGRTMATMIPEVDSSPLKKLSIIAFSKKELTDEQCMIKIYGKRNSVAFANLKSRLYDKLNLLLIIQGDVQIDREEAVIQRIDNLKKIVAGIILITAGSIDMGLQTLERATIIAIKKTFTENIILSAKQLIIGYGSERYNKYKHNKYLEIQRKYINIYLWEIKAQNYYLDLQKTNINSLTIPTKEFINRSVQYIKDLENANEINSPLFLYNKYRIKAIYYEYIKDFDGLLKISYQAIKDFTIPNYKLPPGISNINIRIILALIQTGRFRAAIEFGRKVMPKIMEGSNSWFRLKYYMSKAYLYTGNYSAAMQLIISISNKKHLKLYPNYNEIVKTMLGYMHLLIDTEYVTISTNIKGKIPDFKLGKYLNSVPIYSKDKRGINVSILLMQVAFLLIRKDFNAIIDRSDSLKQYAYRYLRRDDSFRSNCMIKMVIQMTKADFNPMRTERYTADLLKQLKSVNLAGSGENIEIEIIPFEVLWDIMLKSLKE